MTAIHLRSASILLTLLVVTAPATADAQQDLQALLDAADPERIQRDVNELAGAAYAGRATGAPELIDAARFVRDQLEAAGMRPAIGDTSYFQRFRVDYNEILTPAALSAICGQDTLHFELFEDFVPDQHSGSGSFFQSELTVVDSSSAAAGYPGVSGRVALYLTPATYSADSLSNAFDERQLPVLHQLRAARALDSAGAVGMIVPGIIYGRIGMEAVEGFPIFVLKSESLDRMISIADGKSAIRMSGEATATLHRHREAVNVLARWEGSDPDLSDDHVFVTAHMDHVGTIAGAIHFGAHDNASGTAVMIEVARLLQKAVARGMHPRRSVMFVGFSGEEMGLVGSRHYVEADPVVSLEKISAVLNLDIVGGGTGFMMVGALAYPRYYALVADVNDAWFGHELRQRENAPNSDHFFFGDHGVPAAFLYGLQGPPVAIHTPDDVAERMDESFMAETARFAFSIVWHLANLDANEATKLRAERSR